MARHNEVVKRGSFKGIVYSSVKKYSCEKGELILTLKNLQINCGKRWTKIFPSKEIGVEAKGKALKVYDIWYGRVLFKLIVDEAEEWEEAFRDVGFKDLQENMERSWNAERKRPEELKKLFDIDPMVLKKVYADFQKERTRFRRKNIKFNLEIHGLIRILKNRKLKAYLIAHSYVAWYEWAKALLYSLYKAKFGKGPENDEELLKFLDEYPSLGFLDMKELGIEANQIRNCVAHEKFYYDYKPSELVFIVKKKEKRVRLRRLESRRTKILNTYVEALRCLKEKVEKGEISQRPIM